MKTVMITGCSSGFGLELARFLLEQDWSVVATMRRPDESVLPRSERLRVLPLDVTDRGSIAAAVAAAGPVDALINNAGIGWLSALEGTPEAMVRTIFETNTFGTIEMVRAVLPQMRARGSGLVVNVSSSVTLKALPLLSIYTASKMAVNGFTECLALELAPLGIRTHLVLPGQAPGTAFSSNARAMMANAGDVPAAYAAFTEATIAALMQNAAQEPTTPDDVVRAIWRVLTDPDAPFCVPAGSDALALAA